MGIDMIYFLIYKHVGLYLFVKLDCEVTQSRIVCNSLNPSLLDIVSFDSSLRA